MTLSLLVAAAALAAPGAVHLDRAAPGAAYADPATLDLAIARFVGEGVVAQPVDRRLRLAACAAPLALSWYGPARDSVLVRCPEAPGWRIYVPMRNSGGGAGGAPGEGPVAVARGDAVAIAVVGEGFSVAQAGEALEAGAVGAWIRVRTVSAGPRAPGGGDGTLRARIAAPGRVTIALP